MPSEQPLPIPTARVNGFVDPRIDVPAFLRLRDLETAGVPSRNQHRVLFSDVHSDGAVNSVAANAAQSASILFPQARSTIFRYKATIRSMIAFVESMPEVDRMKWEGHEMAREKVVDFLTLYITARLLRSRTPKILKDGTEVTVYLKAHTLRDIAIDCISIAGHICALNTEEKSRLAKPLLAVVAALIRQYNLNTRKPTRLVFSAPEIQLIINAAMTSSNNLDTAIQHVVLLNVFFYSAARPGSVLSTPAYKAFLTIGDVRIFREVSRTSATTVGFTIQVTLHNFKGYQNGNPEIDIEYTVPSTQNRKNLNFDLGVWMLAYLFRRGAFDKERYPSIDSIWAATEQEVEISAAVKKQPLFLKVKERGLGLVKATEDADCALDDRGWRGIFRRLCEKANLGTGLDEVRLSTYCIRRGTAVHLYRTLGEEQAQLYLGHRIRSNQLLETYVNDRASHNLLAAHFGEEVRLEKEVNLRTPAILAQGASDNSTRTVGQLVKTDAVLVRLAEIVHVLEACIKTGTNEWMELDMFSNLRHAIGPEDVFHALNLALNLYRQRVRHWRDAERREIAETEKERRSRLTLEQLRAAHDRLTNSVDPTVDDALFARVASIREDAEVRLKELTQAQGFRAPASVTKVRVNVEDVGDANDWTADGDLAAGGMGAEEPDEDIARVLSEHIEYRIQPLTAQQVADILRVEDLI